MPPRNYMEGAMLFILYAFDARLNYWDVYRVSNSYLVPYNKHNESYWMVPPVGWDAD